MSCVLCVPPKIYSWLLSPLNGDLCVCPLQLRHEEITLQWWWVRYTPKQDGKTGGTEERYKTVRASLCIRDMLMCRSGAFECCSSLGLKNSALKSVHIRVCFLWLGPEAPHTHTHTLAGPCDYFRSFKTHTRAWGLDKPNKIPLITPCSHTCKQARALYPTSCPCTYKRLLL